MAIEEVNQELWDLAVENVTKQQEEAWDGLFDEAVEEHLKDDCPDCKDELCSNCEEQITTRIEEWQESQFVDQAEAEYDRLVEQREEQKEPEPTPAKEEPIPTREEYEAALVALEKMKNGGMLHIFAAHMHTALSYELAHGIRPTTWEKIG